MNEGLITAIVHELDLEDKMLPPDLALVRTLNSEPKSIEKALRGPDAEEWRKALEYQSAQKTGYLDSGRPTKGTNGNTL